jgi:hypothetical protein
VVSYSCFQNQSLKSFKHNRSTIHPLFQFFSDLNKWQLFGSHSNWLTCHRIPPLIGFILFDKIKGTGTLPLQTGGFGLDLNEYIDSTAKDTHLHQPAMI